MPRKGDLLKIPLKTEDAIRLAMKVKPMADMPRPGTAEKATKRKK